MHQAAGHGQAQSGVGFKATVWGDLSHSHGMVNDENPTVEMSSTQNGDDVTTVFVATLF